MEGSNAAELQIDPDRRMPEGTLPDQPFSCPVCGQMLGASCRVCAACKQPIDLTKIKTAAPQLAAFQPTVAANPLARVRFPWALFVALFLVRIVVAMASFQRLGLVKTELLLGGIEFLSAIWVFQDSHARRVPKPLRWVIGSLLFWVVFFPWYLERRKTPQAYCPAVDAQFSPIVRGLLFAAVTLLVLSLIMAALKGPLPH